MSDLFLSPNSSLVIIDIQERLLGSMPDDQVERCLHATRTLVELAAEVEARIVYTEQYPKGLGSTEPSVLEVLQRCGGERVEKVSFDACSAPGFQKYLIELPKRIVVCGMETHICVQSTVRELIARRHDVIVPFDATVSREQEYHQNGLDMMERAGATITNYETLVFDALRTSKHPSFKKFSKMVK